MRILRTILWIIYILIIIIWSVLDIYLDTSPMMLKDYSFSIKTVDEKQVIQEYSHDGASQAANYYDMANLPTDTYKLVFKSDSLGINKSYLINVTNDNQDGIYLIGEYKFDLDNDSKVDIINLATLANKYNVKPAKASKNSPMDFNVDGIIHLFDLVSMFKNMK